MSSDFTDKVSFKGAGRIIPAEPLGLNLIKFNQNLLLFSWNTLKDSLRDRNICAA
jgi:hypothetical protein